jgi:hypothetical protein
MSDEPRKSKSWPWRSAALLFLLAVYVAGYLVLGHTSEKLTGRRITRNYRSSIVVYAYVPLGMLESKISRCTVNLAYASDGEFGVYSFEP